MTFSAWIGQNWFALVQTGLIAGALLLIGLAIALDTRARQITNLIRLTREHRDLWERLYREPELSRILDPTVPEGERRVTPAEELFVIFLILHLGNTFFAMRVGFFRKLRGLRRDIDRFFSLPIPHTVWAKVRDLQEEAFVRFVESSCASLGAEA